MNFSHSFLDKRLRKLYEILHKKQRNYVIFHYFNEILHNFSLDPFLDIFSYFRYEIHIPEIGEVEIRNP